MTGFIVKKLPRELSSPAYQVLIGKQRIKLKRQDRNMPN